MDTYGAERQALYTACTRMDGKRQKKLEELGGNDASDDYASWKEEVEATIHLGNDCYSNGEGQSETISHGKCREMEQAADELRWQDLVGDDTIAL